MAEEITAEDLALINTEGAEKAPSDSEGAEKHVAKSAQNAEKAEEGKKSADGDKGDKSASGDKPKDDGWWSPIPDEKVKAWAKRHPSPTEAAIEGFKLRQQVSNLIKPLGDKATAEEVADYRKKMGVPLKPEGYRFEGIEGKEANDIEKAFHSEMAKVFHEEHIPERTAKKLNKHYNAFVQEFQRQVAENDREDVEKWQTTLRKKWGSDYDTNAAAAKRSLDTAAEESGNADLAKLANLVVDVGDGKKVLLGSFPLFTELSAFWGRRLMEAGPPTPDADSLKEGRARLNDLYDLMRSEPTKYRSREVQNEIAELEAKFGRRRTRAA